MKQLLTDIQRRLAAATTPDGAPLFAYVDFDWGQVDTAGAPPVKFPCALIDVQSASFSDLGQRAQLGQVMVQIRVVDMAFGHSSAGAPDQQRERAARVLDLLRQAHCMLHGWTGAPDRYGRLSRKSVARARRRDGLREYAITFAATLADDSAQPQLQAVAAEPNVGRSLGV